MQHRTSYEKDAIKRAILRTLCDAGEDGLTSAQILQAAKIAEPEIFDDEIACNRNGCSGRTDHPRWVHVYERCLWDLTQGRFTNLGRTSRPRTYRIARQDNS